METNQDGNKIIGKWRSAAKDSEMEFFKTDDTYSAKLLNGWGFGVLTADDKDTKNPDVQLRSRHLLNMVFITDVSFQNGEYKNGKLYLARDGKTLKCEMKFEGEKLILKMYDGNVQFGETKIWSRFQ